MCVRESIIEAFGIIWLPPITAGVEIRPSDRDIGNMGDLTRDDVQAWLYRNVSDFQEILDFHASLEVGPDMIEIPWRDEESEMLYQNLMYGDEY